MFIDGNHENFDWLSILKKTNTKEDGLCHISEHIKYIPRGTVLNLKAESGNIKVACCGGADSVDKYRRTKHISWWEQESITQEDIDRIPAGYYDYVFTHACPIDVFNENKVYLVDTMLGLDQDKINHNSEERLQELADKIDFRHYFFGHYHIDQDLGGGYRCLLNDFIELIAEPKGDLNEIYKTLQLSSMQDEYEIIDVIKDNNENISHIYLKDKENLLYYLIIGPHSGNNYKYLLRANSQKTFDRWSVCEFQKEFNTEFLLLTFLNTNKETIYKEILKEILYYYDTD